MTTILGILLLLLVTAALVTGIVLWIRKRRTVLLTKDEYNLWVGKHFGRFELRSFLVRGDFNTTFRAHDPDSNKTVAIRILDHAYVYSDNVSTQFLLKGELLKFLSEKYEGNHFVQNVRYGVISFSDEQRPYIVSDFVEGASLQQVLDRYGRLSPRDAGLIITQVAESVGLAHRERIWLRELAPKNILLTIRNGRLIASIANVGVPYAKLPTDFAQQIKGGYYAPEDIDGKDVDERSDVYALAALLYRMLEGHEVVDRRDGQEWTGPGGFLRSALSPNPEQRPANVEKFVALLQRLDKAPATMRSLSWDRVLSSLLHGTQHRIVKPSDKEVIPPRRKRTIGQRFGKMRPSVVQAFVVGFVVVLMDKIIWPILSDWKKVTLTLLAIVGAAGYLVYRFVISPTSGEIFVQVVERTLEDSDDLQPVESATLVVEFLDDKGQHLPVSISARFSDARGEGKLELQADGSGRAIVEYTGDFKREEVVLRITARGEHHASFTEMMKALREEVRRDIALRPMRKGTLVVRTSDPEQLVVPGNPAPEAFELEIAVATAEGEPSGDAKLILGKKELTPVGGGLFRTGKLAFGRTHAVAFEVADGSSIYCEPKTEDAPLYLLRAEPRTVVVTAASTSLKVDLQLKKRRGSGQPTTYVFIIQTDDGTAWPIPVEMFLNGRSLGLTGRDGRLEHLVRDPEDFWSSNPSLVVDLRSYKPGWGKSRPYRLHQTSPSQREFPIKIGDIAP